MALRFAEDFMRLRRDLRNYERLAAAMERIQLVRSERTREISRMNNSLYEFLLPSETPSGARPRGEPRGGEGRRARLDAHHPGTAGARAQSRHALQPEFLRAGEAHSGPLRRRQGLYRRRRHGAGHFRDRVQPLAPARRLQGLRAGHARFWPSPRLTTSGPSPANCRAWNWAWASRFKVPRRRTGWIAIRAS